MKKKLVFILEDEVNTRKLLCKVVENHPALELCAAVGSLSDAREALGKGVNPDVFLVDLGLPDGSGITFIREIRRSDSEVPVMVLSVFGDERHVVDAIACGAGGYIHKDEALDEVGRHIDEVLAGESPITPSIAKHILKRMQNAPEQRDKKQSDLLSQRELDVLNILVRGFTRQEVASHLSISQHTVTSHIKSIYWKLKVNSCAEAIFEANQLGLIGERN